MACLQKSVPEDIVEYSLYPPVPDDLESEHMTILLEDLLEAYVTEISPQIINYLWQKDSFELQPVPAKGACPGCLHGKTNYGDNIDDEWFIVYLLFELTKSCPGLVASVKDSDGDFLLIEAAEYLPKWLEPDTSENRIFIYNGELHIIPIPESPAQMSNLPLFTPSISDAVSCIRECDIETRASPQIQNAIRKKLEIFPDKVIENLHYANCYIPTSVAALLEQNPNLVAPAVEAFYFRDPIDLQACRTMKTFQQEDMVIYRVKFTRYMYAQLLQQEFQPDRRSGWTLPSKSNPQFKQDDLGLKLTHGFEILCSKCGGKKSKMNGHSSFNEQDGRWQRYLQALKSKGFFKNELEGSKHYKVLLEEAKSFFSKNLGKQKRRKKQPGDEILELLDNNRYTMEDFKKRERTLPPSDDDSWIEISPEDLDELLHETVGKQPTTAQSDVYDLSQISNSMKSFVKNVSSVDGAEFPKDGEEGDGEGDIQFDGMGFIHAMQKMFDFPEDKDDDSDDMDEYDWEEENSDDDMAPPKGFKLDKPKSKPDHKIKQYMEQMDRELAKTEIGKSFEKTPKQSHPVPPPRTKGKSAQSEKSKQETSNKPKPRARKARHIDDEDDDFRPVDIDLTLVKNTLQSFSAQQGMPGPATNILNAMGINVPKNTEV